MSEAQENVENDSRFNPYGPGGDAPAQPPSLVDELERAIGAPLSDEAKQVIQTTMLSVTVQAMRTVEAAMNRVIQHAAEWITILQARQVTQTAMLLDSQAQLQTEAMVHVTRESLKPKSA